MDFFYITRDVERAVGLLKAGIFVVTNRSLLAEALKDTYNNQLFVVNKQASLSTLELLKLQGIKEFVKKNSRGEQPQIIVFKTSPQIERECERLGWKPLNPSYEVGAVLEEKILQWKWLSTLRLASLKLRRSGQAQGDSMKFELPQVWTGQLKMQSFKQLSSELGERPVVQFNRGHTGLGTFRLNSEEQWKELQAKFPERDVKVARWYEGAPYTINAIVYGTFKVVCGNISKQLTGIPGCTNNPYATVGNDWSEGTNLADEIKRKIYSCADVVGIALRERGYRGMFGIDVIVTDDERVILIEVNPRQPASASLESMVQKEAGKTAIMDQHLKALLDYNASQPPLNIRGGGEEIAGCQLFFRNLENISVKLMNEFAPGRYRVSEKGIELIEKAMSVAEARTGEVFAFSVSKNESVKPGGELLRIQSKNGMVNTLGNEWNRAIQTIRDQVILA